MTSKIENKNMNSSQCVCVCACGGEGIDMKIISPKRSNIMLECNSLNDQLGSFERLKGVKEIIQKN